MNNNRTENIKQARAHPLQKKLLAFDPALTSDIPSPSFSKHTVQRLVSPADEDAHYLQNPIPFFGKMDRPWTQDALKDNSGDSVVRFDGGLKQVLDAMT